MQQRFDFEEKWTKEHPKYNPQTDAKAMREAYVEQYPDDVDVTAKSFADARRYCRNDGRPANNCRKKANQRKSRKAK